MELGNISKQSWVLKQSISLANILALIAFAIITFIALGNHPIETILALLIFLIITTFSQLKQLIIVAIIAAAISAIFPPLGGILAIVAIIMFIVKLKFLIENWRAVLAGLFVYLYPLYICYNFNNDQYYYSNSPNKIVYVVISIILFQIVMIFLYYSGYSSNGALAIMGMLPLMVIVLLIPSIVSELQGSMNSFSNYNYYSSNNAINPNVHNVNGYCRHTPSGDITYVHQHISTNPDDIESNNISYKP